MWQRWPRALPETTWPKPRSRSAQLAAAPLLEPLGGLAAAALPQLPPLRCRDAWLLEDEAEPPAAPQARRRTRPSALRAPNDVHAALDAWELFLARVYMRLHSRALGLPVPAAWQPRHVIYALGAGWASADMRLAFDTDRVSYMVRFWGRNRDAAGMPARELAAFVGAPDPSVPLAPTVLANGAFMDRHFHGQEQRQRLVFKALSAPPSASRHRTTFDSLNPPRVAGDERSTVTLPFHSPTTVGDVGVV